MDFTKKIVRKLAGSISGTASLATNVGNERRQVLMAVLTVNEGTGLKSMVNGLTRRYSKAGVLPPKILYIDRDCCSATKSKDLFSLCDNLVVRLDIWHLMRCITVSRSTVYSLVVCPSAYASGVNKFWTYLRLPRRVR